MNNKNNLALEHVDESLASSRLPPASQTAQTSSTSRSFISWLSDSASSVTTTWSNLRKHRWLALSVGLGVVGSLVYAGPSWDAAKSLSFFRD